MSKSKEFVGEIKFKWRQRQVSPADFSSAAKVLELQAAEQKRFLFSPHSDSDINIDGFKTAARGELKPYLKYLYSKSIALLSIWHDWQISSLAVAQCRH